jgi:hypothetical protein
MAFTLGSSQTARLSWLFGDTPLYRFVFDIPSDAQLPVGTMLDFSIRTPNGIKVCNISKNLEMPIGNLPYFEIFISPTLSYAIPPGNYLFTLALRRPYSGDGNYRYTPFPSGNVTVGGIQSLLPENLAELEGHTDPPPPMEIHIDAKPFITRTNAVIQIPPLAEMPGAPAYAYGVAMKDYGDQICSDYGEVSEGAFTVADIELGKQCFDAPTGTRITVPFIGLGFIWFATRLPFVAVCEPNAGWTPYSGYYKTTETVFGETYTVVYGFPGHHVGNLLGFTFK